MCAIRLRPTFFSESRGKFFVQIISVVQMESSVCVCVRVCVFLDNGMTFDAEIWHVFSSRYYR